jgi:hypothetical protein
VRDLREIWSRLVAAAERLNNAREELRRVEAEKEKAIAKHKPFHLETREVLAACYLGPNKGRTMLSHSVEVGATGMVIRSLCDRVSPLSLADKWAQDTTQEPTCKPCQRKKKKWKP